MSREKWTPEKVESGIRKVIEELGLDRMPTSTEIRRVTGNHALAGKVAKDGGYDSWAARLGLPVSNHDSRKGWAWESWVSSVARERNLHVEPRSRVKDKFDLLIGSKRVEVKSAVGAVIAGEIQWTWGIHREHGHNCDLYFMVAVGLDGGPSHLLIVPAAEVPLTCMTMRSGLQSTRARSIWFDRWDLLS